MAAHFPARQRPLERPGKEEGRDSMLAQAFLSSAVAAPQPPRSDRRRGVRAACCARRSLRLACRREDPRRRRLGGDSRASSRARYGERWLLGAGRLWEECGTTSNASIHNRNLLTPSQHALSATAITLRCLSPKLAVACCEHRPAHSAIGGIFFSITRL